MGLCTGLSDCEALAWFIHEVQRICRKSQIHRLLRLFVKITVCQSAGTR